MVAMTLITKTQGRRTLLFEDDLHVGTIFEVAREAKGEPGIYQWYTAHSGGRAKTRDAAVAAIEEELER